MSETQPDNLEALIVRQQQSWRSGHFVTIEQLLGSNPSLSDQCDALLDLIYSEILLREELGEAPSESEYINRFPHVEVMIHRQFQLHRALQALPSGQASVEPPLPMGSDTLDLSDDAQNTEGNTLPVEVHQSIIPQIPGFAIVGVAGRGGSGVAFRARDLRLNRTVAIKLLDRNLLNQHQGPDQLFREAQATATLDHEHIVQVLQVGEVDGMPFLVVEFMEGGSLADRLKSGPLPTERAVEIAIGVCQAISHAHQSGLIHRDLKPGNILFDKKLSPKVCDFGLARRLDGNQTFNLTGDVVGTPAYMPPEQARGKPVDQRADIYSLGAVLYEMLGGRAPFQAASPWEILHQVLNNDVLSLRQINPTVPKDLETICGKCLEKECHKRYQTAEDLAEELMRFQRGEPIRARPLGPLARGWKWAKRHPAVAGLISVVVLSITAILLVLLISRQQVQQALQRTQIALTQTEQQRSITEQQRSITEQALQETEKQRRLAEKALREANLQREIAETAQRLAEQQRQVAVDAINNLVYQVHDDLQRRQASVEARGEVLKSAIAGLEKIRQEAGDDEETRISLATALTRYGYILTQQGRNEDAEKIYQQSIEVADTLISDRGLKHRAQNYSNFALYFVRAAKFEMVDLWSKKTLELAEQLLKNSPDDFDLLNIKVQSLTQQASALNVFRGAAASMELRKQARELSAKIVSDHPDREELVNQLIDGDLLLIQDYITLEKWQDAQDLVHSSLSLIQKQSPESTEDVQIQRRYVSLLRFQAMLLFYQAEYYESLQHLEKCLKIYDHLAAVEPNRPGFQLRLGVIYDLMGDCWMASNDLDKSLDFHQRSIDSIREGMRLGGPSYAVQAYATMGTYIKRYLAFLKMGKVTEARTMLDMALKELEPILDQFNTRSIYDQIHQVKQLFLDAQQNELVVADDAVRSQEIQAFKHALEVWLQIQAGQDTGFSEIAGQLEEQMNATNNLALKSMLESFLIGDWAAYHQGLVAQMADPTLIEQAEDNTIRLLQQSLTRPDADRYLHLKLPEFASLRNSQRFRQQFGLPSY